MNVDKKLDLLKSIRQVDPSPGLFGRIRQQIETKEQPWNRTAIAAAIALVLLLNGVAIYKHASWQPKPAKLQSVAQMMHLSSSTDINYE